MESLNLSFFFLIFNVHLCLFSDPSQSELMGEPHLMVEYKLGLLWCGVLIMEMEGLHPVCFVFLLELYVYNIKSTDAWELLPKWCLIIWNYLGLWFLATWQLKALEMILKLLIYIKTIAFYVFKKIVASECYTDNRFQFNLYSRYSVNWNLNNHYQYLSLQSSQ